MHVQFDPEHYFERQSSVHGYGGRALGSLQNAKVAVVGCGGVGSAAIDYLARSGIGHLSIIDQDIVDPTNLHRLHCVGPKDVYRSKAEALSRNLKKTYPWLQVQPIIETVRPENVDDTLDGTDLLVDGLDNFRTRYVLNTFSLRHMTPYLFASAIANQAHASLFNPPDTPCLECVFPSPSSMPDETCERLGVTAPIIGLVGAIIASEAVRFLLGEESQLQGSLLTADLAGPDFVVSKMAKRSDCPSCNGHVTPENDRFEASLTVLCSGRTASITPAHRVKLDLGKIAKHFEGELMLLSASDRALVYKKGDTVVSVFVNGRLIIRGVSSEDQARSIAVEVWQMLGVNAPFPIGWPMSNQ